MQPISPLSLDLIGDAWTSEVPSPPHDALSPADRLQHLEKFPLSYLGVTRAPEDVSPDHSMSPAELLAAGRRSLDALLNRGVFNLADQTGYFVYRLTLGDHSQTGLVCGVAVSAYDNGQIRIHERTKQDRAIHLANHLDVVGAQSSPIAMAARPQTGLADALKKLTSGEAELDFVSPDGLRQQVWRIDDPDAARQLEISLDDEPLYLIDGHHRAAAASVHRASRLDYGGLSDGDETPGSNPEPSPGIDWMLSVVFPIEELRNEAFHRILPLDRNEQLHDELLTLCRAVSATDVNGRQPSEVPIGVRDADGQLCWYLMDLPLDDSVVGPSAILANLDPVRVQQQIFEPVMKIDETRPGDRLYHRAGTSSVDGSDSDAGNLIRPGEAAIVTRPVTMDELMAASDNGLVMPPKSTYFVPKVRSGLFLHRKHRI